MTNLPIVRDVIVIEINQTLVDAEILGYLKGKKAVKDAPYKGADSARLLLKGLPMGGRTIETETTMGLKYLKEIMKKQKTGEDNQLEERAGPGPC